MVKELVERIRNHDQRAMSQLYQRYVGRLSSVCYRYVPDENDAKDVLQNSFVKIFTALPTIEYRSEEAFWGWMVKVVINEALHFLRDRRRLRFVSPEQAASLAMEEDESELEWLSPDDLHQLISELPDGYRTVVNLYIFEGYSHRKIAEMLGISESTSASQLYFAKQLLAKRIKEFKKIKMKG